MSTKIIIGIVLLILVGGGIYAMQNKTQKNDSQPMSQTTNEAEEFAKAIESGKPTVCTITKDSNTMEYSIKGKMMRIKTTSTLSVEQGESKTTVGHMINDGNYFYTWSDESKQGTKISLTDQSPLPSSSSSTEIKEFDSVEDYNNLKNEGYTISCKTGVITDAVFVPPSDIKFLDTSELMKQVVPQGENGQIDLKKLQEQYGGNSD